MSWIHRLHQTYELCAGAPQFERDPLLPVSHAEQQAHIEIVLDQDGKFQRAAVVNKETTVFPATEKSTGRTGKKPPPHPLCDKVQYCAGDYKDHGGAKDSFFDEYVAQLRRWCEFGADPKVEAVLRYVEGKHLVGDLLQVGILHAGADGRLLTNWESEEPAPQLFRMLTPKENKRDQGDAFVRWRVQVPGDPISGVWEDPRVRNSWIQFDTSNTDKVGLCMVTGERVPLAANHPKRLRHGADGAKLLSSNDAAGFTFRGRVDLASQAYGVGSAATQKAHSALRWLIARQGYHDKATGQVFLSWSVAGKPIPDPLLDTAALFSAAASADEETQYRGDDGQHFGLRLRKAIAGYHAKLEDSDDVVVIGLDSATPGRMAITYYRELTGLEFVDRVQGWHTQYAWFQKYSRDNQFVGAPAPKEIAEAVYGRRLDDRLKKATVERLLPCIVDSRLVPRDLVESCTRRVCNRVGLEGWEWEKALGIACSLVRGTNREEGFQMALEESRNTRDYLFGRLLAIAENIEQWALHIAGENRDTTAGRLMQRFADRPCSTWRNIELALGPYRSRLRVRRPSVLLERDKLLDKVVCLFPEGTFTSDQKLSGEFLLGYHCQRTALWEKHEPVSEAEEKTSGEGETK